jgi:5-methylcytosine-specific restriction endonuclease McrA
MSAGLSRPRSRRSLGRLQKLALKKAAWDKTGGHCYYCGCKLWDYTKDWRARPAHLAWLELDHIEAHSRGGDLSADNIVPSCNRCNSGKCDRGIEEYRAVLERKRGAPVRFYGETCA